MKCPECGGLYLYWHEMNEAGDKYVVCDNGHDWVVKADV